MLLAQIWRLYFRLDFNYALEKEKCRLTVDVASRRARQIWRWRRKKLYTFGWSHGDWRERKMKRRRVNLRSYLLRMSLRECGRVNSVTRWLDYFFKIWPFRTSKICPIELELCQSRIKNGQILNRLFQDCQSLLKFYQSVRNFAKSGHTESDKECICECENHIQRVC